MRLPHFFIDRPIFAAVVSIVFLIVGGVSYARLPIAQYPEIAPPTINVQGQYPGASADVVASTVVTPIEQQINGVENMIYMSSNSTADGRFTIAISFELGTNLDIAQVQVQNRVAIAQPRLPDRGADAWPLGQCRRVLRHRGETDGYGGGPAARRRAHRAGGAGLFDQFLSRPRSGGGACDFSTSGVERAGHRQEHHCDHGR